MSRRDAEAGPTASSGTVGRRRSYADNFGEPDQNIVLAPFIKSGLLADSLGLGINAGHDLNLINLANFCTQVKNVAEVSIGHAIITDALWMGLGMAVSKYREILDQIQ